MDLFLNMQIARFCKFKKAKRLNIL